MSDGTKVSYKPGPHEFAPVSKIIIKASERELRRAVIGAVLGRPVGRYRRYVSDCDIAPLHGKVADK